MHDFSENEQYVIRDKSVELVTSGGTTVKEEIARVDRLEVVRPPSDTAGKTAAQRRDQQRFFAASVNVAGQMLKRCICETFGEVDTGNACPLYNILVHDFGYEKVRFVSERGTSATAR